MHILIKFLQLLCADEVHFDVISLRIVLQINITFISFYAQNFVVVQDNIFHVLYLLQELVDFLSILNNFR